MTIRAVCFDLGGVIIRTVDQQPRLRLAERLGIPLKDLYRRVFDCPAAAQASLGQITDRELWAAVAADLKWPLDQAEALRDAFFAGDTADPEIIAFLRGSRGKVRTGLISNAWPDLRAYLETQGITDAFDEMIISAEVGIVKPDARIYQIAIEKMGVAPQEAVFIDDVAANVAAAVALGWRGIVYRETAATLDTLNAMLREEGPIQ